MGDRPDARRTWGASIGFAWSLGPATDRRADRDDEASEFERKDMVMECMGIVTMGADVQVKSIHLDSNFLVALGERLLQWYVMPNSIDE